MESAYTCNNVVAQKMSAPSAHLVKFHTHGFYHDTLGSVSSGLHLPLQVLIHLLPVSRTVFPPQDLVPDILLPETLHSLLPSLDQCLLIPPFQFRHNFRHQLSTRLPNGLRQAYPRAMYHKVLRGTFLKGKSDHGTVKLQ